MSSWTKDEHRADGVVPMINIRVLPADKTETEKKIDSRQNKTDSIPVTQVSCLLWPPCVADIFVLFFFFCFPRLISAVADWMSTILPHMVWP